MKSVRWYALQSKPRQENTLWQQLIAEGIESYYPHLRVRPVNPRTPNLKPYFPGYLFVHIDVDAIGLQKFTWMPHAIGLVCFSNEPSCVADGLIEGVRCAVAQVAQSGMEWYGELMHGDRVRIRSGPFEGYQAIFDARMSGYDRVRILLELLGGRSMALEMSAARLEKIERR